MSQENVEIVKAGWGIADLSVGLAAGVLAFVVHLEVLWIWFTPIAVVFTAIGVIEIIVALRRRRDAAFR